MMSELKLTSSLQFKKENEPNTGNVEYLRTYFYHFLKSLEIYLFFYTRKAIAV